VLLTAGGMLLRIALTGVDTDYANQALPDRRFHQPLLWRQSCSCLPVGTLDSRHHLQAIATEKNLSETAFFVPKGSDFGRNLV
jgi:hypothetical protein